MNQPNKFNVDLLKKHSPFDGLRNTNLEDVLGNISLKKLKSGTVLFKREDPASKVFYILRGNLDLCDKDFNITKIDNSHDLAKHPLDNKNPHEFSGVLTSDSIVFSLDRKYLDRLLAVDQSGGYMVDEMNSEEENLESDWMSKLLQSPIIHKVPPANIQQLFVQFTETSFNKGDKIIEEGDDGDAFYVLKSGVAVVSQKMEGKDKAIAKLSVGDFFGEDALIGSSKRNATITMLEQGVLMKLTKDQFKELLQEPVLKRLSESDFQKMKEDTPGQLCIIDVRFSSEFRLNHFEGSINVPLASLRKKLPTMDSEKTYIIATDGDSRSELGAYLFNKFGYNTYIYQYPNAS